jgi:L-cystine uptake protein TcyP (sodium:dicarboxylate symporter family)
MNMLSRQDILRQKSELAVLKKEKETLDISANNSLVTILDALSPYNIQDDVTDLNIRSAEVEFKQLISTVAEIKEKKEKIQKIEKILKDIESALA